MKITQKHIVKFILDDVESIRAGLRAYSEILVLDEIDVLFAYIDGEEIKPLQATHGQLDCLQKIDDMSDGSYVNYTHSFESDTSEGIFFSHAMKFPALLDDIVTAVHEIVNYAVRHNDTDDMWNLDVRVFGLDPVFLLGLYHSEYIYLLGSFYIPYWDMEHANYAADYLTYIFNERGFDEQVMKAFCHCDNEEGRLMLLGASYDSDKTPLDLVALFRDNIDKYNQFKDMLKERFVHQDFLQVYKSHDHTDRPITEFYQTIMQSSHEELSLNCIFIDNTFDNEAYILQQEIELITGKPLAIVLKDNDNDDKEYWDNNHYSVCKDLFVNGFENGAKVWEYVLSGGQDIVIENIKAKNIIKMIKDNKLLIKERIQDYDKDDYKWLEDVFYLLIEMVMQTFYKEQSNGMVMTINGADTTGRDVVLRVVDIFYKLIDRHILRMGLYEVMVNENIITAEQFFMRYDDKCSCYISAASYLLCELQLSKNPIIFARIYNYININRNLVITLFKGEGKSAICGGKLQLSREEYKAETQLKFVDCGLIVCAENISLAVAILANDYNKMTSDDLTSYLMSYVRENWLTPFISTLMSEKQFTSDEIGLIKKYIDGPSRQAMMGLMFMQKPEVTDGKSDTVTLDMVVELCSSRLKRLKYQKQKAFEIFEVSSDSLYYLIPMLYASACFINIDGVSDKAKRIMQLLAQLAPLEVLEIVDNTIAIIRTEYDLFTVKRDMSRLIKNKDAMLAFEISIADEDGQKNFANMYVEDRYSASMFDKSIPRADIKLALTYLDEYTVSDFYDMINEISEEVGFVNLNEQFLTSVKSLVIYNLSHNSRDDLKLVDIITAELINYLTGSIDKAAMTNFHQHIKKVSTARNFDKSLWKVKEHYLDKCIMLFRDFGVKGLAACADSDADDNVEYIACMLELDTSIDLIVEYVLYTNIAADMASLDGKIAIYERLKNHSIEDKEKALKLAIAKNCHLDYIKKIAQENSIRLKNIASTYLASVE